MRAPLPGEFENWISSIFVIGGGLSMLWFAFADENIFKLDVSGVIVIIGTAFMLLEMYLTDGKGYMKNAREGGLIE
jgi:hypothetical protein